MSTDQEVRAHYRHGNLEEILLTAVAAMGKDPTHLSPTDLMGLTNSTLAVLRRQVIWQRNLA